MNTKIVDEHIFDSFLKEPDIHKWARMNPSFPDVMREKLHFKLDGGESYNKLFPEYPHTHSELEQYKEILENLNTVDTEVYGNFVLSEWRYLTHWSGGFDPEPAAYFFQHALPTLVEKMNGYELSTLITDPSPFDHQEEQKSSDAGSAENNYMSFSEVYKRGEEAETEAFIQWDQRKSAKISSYLNSADHHGIRTKEAYRNGEKAETEVAELAILMEKTGKDLTSLMNFEEFPQSKNKDI